MGRINQAQGWDGAISKDFIEAQNGRIWGYSAIGEESTFGFNLPVGAV